MLLFVRLLAATADQTAGLRGMRPLTLVRKICNHSLMNKRLGSLIPEHLLAYAHSAFYIIVYVFNFDLHHD
jgi:predicted DNA repair protein MutK